MIRGGNVTVELKVDTSNFVAAITSVVRQMLRLDFALEVKGLSEHQVYALMFVRGAFHPDFADEAMRDQYLRAIASHPTMGVVAAGAFLRGWATHRPGAGDPINAFAWHRYFGGKTDTVVRVSVA